jgi:LEA14-like dessication related protein
MAEISRFWTTNGTGDGTSGGYTAANFAEYMGNVAVTSAASEGVLFGVLNNLAVTTTGVTRQVSVNSGAAIADAKFYKSDAAELFTLDSTASNRADRLVLRVSYAAQTVRLALVKGTDGSATPPALTQSAGTTWEISIATIAVNSANVLTITDTRTYCKSPLAYGWFNTALTLNSTLTVSSNATVTGNLAVNGTASFSNALSGTGIVGATNLATDSVTTVKIANSNVTTAKIADYAVTSVKVATGAITSTELATDSVTTVKILASNVTSAKIADGAIVEAKLASAAVTSAKIGAGAVLTTNIGDSQVTSAKIADANITTAKLAANAIVTTSITDLNVTTAKIAASAVTSAKIGASAVQTANIADYAVESLKLDTSAVTTAKIADVNVTEAKIASSAVTSGKIASGAVTLGKLATNSIDEDNIKADVVTGLKIGEWAVKFGGRQGGNSDNWATPGISEYKNPISATYGSEVLMCSGSIQISISAAASGTANVTFYDKDTGSAPFATNPIMVIANNGSPDYIIDISAISTSGGTVRATHKAGTSATTTVTVWWIAIGTTTI